MHTSVLLHETIDAVVTNPNGLYVDATYGRGGHARLLLSRLSPAGRLIAFDRDHAAVMDGQALAKVDARFSMIHAPFSAMTDLDAASVTGVVMDLGISSPQIDDAARGFSFMRDGPLDMRMDVASGVSVAQWLATAPQSQIAEVIHEYGEERHARLIAAAIVTARQAHDIQRTSQLAKIVAGAIQKRGNKDRAQHPATRTFQAFRIFINDEIGQLQRALSAIPRVLHAEGRMGVISFHSLEDRCVKQFIAQHSKEQFDPRSPQRLMPTMSTAFPLKDRGRIKPSTQEIAANPRSRSAVLRVAERTSCALGDSLMGAALLGATL